MPAEVGAAVRAAAASAGVSISRWIESAAADRLRNELLGYALDEWEREDGVFTREELDRAAEMLGLNEGAKQ